MPPGQNRDRFADVDDSVEDVDVDRIDLNDDGNSRDGGRKRIKFTMRGNPRALIRHRTARGFVYNPSREAQETFRDRLLEMLPSRFRPTITDDDDYGDDGGVAVPSVLFSECDCLDLSIVFRMKRPLNHFVASRRAGPNARLKAAYAGTRWPPDGRAMRSDVDNLAKFVMDSLNGVLYVDDRQVVRLSAMKVLDSEGSCLGATEVEISVLAEGDL